MKCALACLAAAAAHAAAAQDAPLVSLTCGKAAGAWIEPDAITPQRVAVWRSLPYGAPTGGSGRWKPPQPAVCWTGTFNASAFGSVCPQGNSLDSEDCLQLTVYVPEAVYNGSSIAVPVPVLFYIHGGGLMGGSGIWEDPSHFVAQRNVVSVVINYRLNIFGFLATSELTAEQGGVSGNYGIMDQQLALRWTQANVRAFGGDPNRVTLAGQSSGGTSIFALLSSPASKGLFHAAIPMSGSPNITIDLPAAEVQNSGIFAAAGCGSPATPADRVACMRNASIWDLEPAIPASWGTPGLWGVASTTGGMNYAGLPVIDGVTLTHSYPDAMRLGLVDVPLMVGNMGQECDGGPDVQVRGMTQTQWQAWLTANLRVWGPDAGAAIYSAYATDSVIDPQRAYDDINADYGLSCAFKQIAVDAKQGAYQSPIYLFVNEWPPSTPIPRGDGWSIEWAYHTWDWKAVTMDWPDNWTPGPRDNELALLLMDLWTDLMEDGRLSAASGWKSVEQVPSFPAQYGTFVFANPEQPPYMNASFVANYKTSQCDVLVNQFNLDQRYWWCD